MQSKAIWVDSVSELRDKARQEIKDGNGTCSVRVVECSREAYEIEPDVTATIEQDDICSINCLVVFY